MSGYTKLFSSIVTSTIWCESKETRILWITMLAMVDKDAIVEGSIPGLARHAGLTVEETIAALKVLESPDPFSRSPDDDGRRIRSAPGGWFLVNYAKYRDMVTSEDRKEYLRRKQAEGRAKSEATPTTTALPRGSGYLFVVATPTSVKIGLSKNPWARAAKIKESEPAAELIGTTKGDESSLAALHQRFAHLAIKDEWFRSDPEILAFSASLKAHKEPDQEATTPPSTTCPTVSVSSEVQKVTSFQEVTPPATGGVLDEDDWTPTDADIAMAQEGEGEPQAALELDAAPDPKGFPWGQLYAIMKAELPEITIPSNGARRDVMIKAFWRRHGKSTEVFRLLAQKMKGSDYLMGRNGHRANAGKPYPWGWIFDKRASDGKVRADAILAGDYATEAMAWVLDKNSQQAEKIARGRQIKVVIVGENQPRLVNADEQWKGSPRFKICDPDGPQGFPVVIDYGET